MRQTNSISLLTTLGLFALALGLRAILLGLRPFDGLYGQDPYAYYDYAVTLRAGLLSGQPIPPFFWPVSYPLHIAGLMLLLGVQPMAGQLVSVMAGALIAPMTFLLTSEALHSIDPRRARRAGLIAGLIVVVAGQLMISSLSIMSDATALAWATASAWLVLRYTRTQRPSTLGLAALTLAVAVITRWVYALLVLPWSVCVLLTWRRDWSTIGWRRAMPLSVLAVMIGGTIVGTQLLSGAHTGDLQVVGWDPANAVQSTVVNSDGTFHYSMPIGLFYARPLIDPSFIFPLLAPLWIAGLVGLIRDEQLPSSRAVLIGWPITIYVFLAGIAWQNPRFSLALFPPLAVWVGLGFDRVWMTRPAWQPALIGLVTIALIGAGLWSLRDVSNFVEQKNTDLARAQYLAVQLPSGTPVITFGLTLTIGHYTALNPIDIYNATPTTLAQRVCGRGAYAFLDMTNLERQWIGLAPDMNYRWLRDNPTLLQVDQFRGYTLFKVGSACP